MNASAEPFRTPPRHTRLFCSIALLLLGAAPLDAQTLRGNLLEEGTGRPLEGATVVLLDTEQKARAQAQTDAEGRFRLHAPGPGRYSLRASRLGYTTARTEALALELGERVEVELRLGMDAVAIEPLTVVARSRSKHLERMGFYDRQKVHFGHFITREEIERRNPTLTSSLFRNIPGVRVVRNPIHRNSGYHLATTRTIQPCGITHYYVDGVPLAIEPDVSVNPAKQQGRRPPRRSSTGASSVDIDMIHPQHIEAIEIYRGPAEIPPQYNRTGSVCGVVLIWTRVGP